MPCPACRSENVKYTGEHFLCNDCGKVFLLDEGESVE